MIEIIDQPIAEGSGAQGGMNVGEIVVHAAAMDADDISQRMFHGMDAPARDAESSSEIAKIIIVARGSNGVEKRRDRCGEVFVDVGVGPDHCGWLCLTQWTYMLLCGTGRSRPQRSDRSALNHE